MIPLKGEMKQMGNAVNDKDSQVDYLKNRLNMFMEVVDSLDPESTELEDVDRLISMLDDLEGKFKRFQKDWDSEKES